MFSFITYVLVYCGWVALASSDHPNNSYPFLVASGNLISVLYVPSIVFWFTVPSPALNVTVYVFIDHIAYNVVFPFIVYLLFVLYVALVASWFSSHPNNVYPSLSAIGRSTFAL